MLKIGNDQVFLVCSTTLGLDHQLVSINEDTGQISKWHPSKRKPCTATGPQWPISSLKVVQSHSTPWQNHWDGAPGELDVAEGTQGQLSHLEGENPLESLGIWWNPDTEEQHGSHQASQWEFSALLRAKEASPALLHFFPAFSLPAAPQLETCSSLNTGNCKDRKGSP